LVPVVAQTKPPRTARNNEPQRAIAILTPSRIESSIQPPPFLRGPLNKVSALYPGSFDPPTNGHLDLIERGAKIFEELVVGILRNSEKIPMFSLAERFEMLKTLTAHLKNVRIETFHGLMVEYAKSIEATCVLRGIRAVSDYEYELQMALMNRKLEPTLETVFMMPADKYSYVSSRLVREVAQAGGPVKGLVPEVVEQKLREKLEPAYKFHDEMQQVSSGNSGGKEIPTKKRKKKS
jgi:pantetheine-phosphate adenylyltransferase